MRATPRRSRPAGSEAAADTYDTTLDVNILGSYHLDINMDDPVLGGEEGLLLRQAIQQAINRDEINEAVYEGIGRTVSNGVTPEGIPGWGPDLCDICTYDPEAAAGELRRVDGRRQRADGADPAPVQHRSEPRRGGGDRHRQPRRHRHRGRPGRRSTRRRTSRSSPTAPASSAGPAGTPTTRRTTTSCTTCSTRTRPSVATTTRTTRTPSSTRLVDEAKATTDLDEQGELFHEAETILLEDVGGDPDQLVQG